jgi:Domain of unknown function (DUF4365)
MSDALLSKNDRMEALSRAYVEAVAAHAGYVVSMANFDRDSVDLTIEAGATARPKISVQLKATSAIPPKATTYNYPLPVKNYNDLRGVSQTPRILVVLSMPKAEKSWLNHGPQRLILKRCAYWKSILGMGPTTNTETVSIPISMSDVFDVQTLIGLMDKSRNGVPL